MASIAAIIEASEQAGNRTVLLAEKGFTTKV
jgi:hypothetical protein